MITVVRLRPRTPQRNWLLRSYTSSRGNRYVAGTDAHPAPWRSLRNPDEIAELAGESDQFEIRQFADEAALAEHAQGEFEARVREGKPAVRAAIITGGERTETLREAELRRARIARAVALTAPTSLDGLTPAEPDLPDPVPQPIGAEPVAETFSAEPLDGEAIVADPPVAPAPRSGRPSRKRKG